MNKLHQTLNRLRLSDEGEERIMRTDWIAYEAEQAGFEREEEKK